MNNMGYVSIRPGHYHVAIDNEKIGTLRGDYAIGFEAIDIRGQQVGETFATPGQAAEVLALETSLRDLFTDGLMAS